MTDTGFSQPLVERVELPGTTQVSAMSQRPPCTRVRPCACASPVHARRGRTRWFCDRARAARADWRGVRVVQGFEYRVRSDLEAKKLNMQEKVKFEKAGILLTLTPLPHARAVRVYDCVFACMHTCV